ncbi:MAG: methyltransferase domain-containing protein [Nitrososphaerota archaeon]|jgi:SAM-dependent methyltransferase|nr:methyltransferase domain-containing protein [Nitrososphaerota archaeon]
MRRMSYSKRFYENSVSVTMASAEEIMPLIIKYFAPKSVVDVGCGIGSFLKVAMKMGVQDVLGIDGPWVTEYIKGLPFLPHDLTAPLCVGRKFDVAICLEVIEHIPYKYPQVFVRSLPNLEPCKVFSVAIPFQGGTQHVNERWPTYCEELFRDHGLYQWDYIRWEIWDNQRIEPRYRQNPV